MKNFLANRATQASLVGGAVVSFVVGLASVAGAVAYDPTSDLTHLASNATSTASPILIGVIIALIPMFIVFLVIGWVKGLFHRR